MEGSLLGQWLSFPRRESRSHLESLTPVFIVSAWVNNCRSYFVRTGVSVRRSHTRISALGIRLSEFPAYG